MFDFMDGIVEGVEEFAEAAVDFVCWTAINSVKLIITLTTPIWILPYKVWRERSKRHE